MFKTPSLPPISGRTLRVLRQKLRVLIGQTPDHPVRARRRFAPSVRSLEPRFVLDAGGVLDACAVLDGSILSVTGTPGEDMISMTVDADGLQLRDADGIIEIRDANDPGGAPLQKIDPATFATIQFDTLGGDDLLNLELPSGLNVTVVNAESDGQDTAIITSSDPGDASGLQPRPALTIASETIHLATANIVSLDQNDVQLQGNVSIVNRSNAPIDPNQTKVIDLGTGSLEIEGRLILESHLRVLGENGELDLSDTVVSASRPGLDLTFVLGTQAGSKFEIAGADDFSATPQGAFVDDFAVVSAHDVWIGSSSFQNDPSFQIAGELSLDADGSIQFAVPTTVGSVLARSDVDLSVDAALLSADDVVLVAGGELEVLADVRVSGDLGGLSLRADSVLFDGPQEGGAGPLRLTTTGGSIEINGDLTIDGDVLIDSASGVTAAPVMNAGLIEIVSPIHAQVDPEMTPVDSLRIQAIGTEKDGTVRIDSPVGGDGRDLNRFQIDAGQIEVNSIRVKAGDVGLRAATTQLFGSDVQTTESGDVTLDTVLLLPDSDRIRIRAAGDVAFMRIEGQDGTGNLQVAAGRDVTFGGTVTMIRDLDVVAGRTVTVNGRLDPDGRVVIAAPTIQVNKTIDTTGGDFGGNVELFATAAVTVASRITVGTASIAINGGGTAAVDTGLGILESDSTDDAVTIQNASTVRLGDVRATLGTLRIGIDRGEVTGLVDQADGTSLDVDQITARTLAEINLANEQNKIREIESILATKVTVNDSADDLIVRRVDTVTNGAGGEGGDVKISASAGSLRLFDGAVVATAATTTLLGSRSIVDVEPNSNVANIRSGRVVLRAGVDGIGVPDNPVDVIASVAIDADTRAANGNVHLANRPGEILVGLIDAGDGEVTLQADSIDEELGSDTSGDPNDITANRLVLTAVQGIGDSSAIELTAIADLTATTARGAIRLDLTATRDTRVTELSSGQGDIELTQSGPTSDVALVKVLAVDGAITVVADGSIDAINVESSNVSEIDDALAMAPTRDVMLTTVGSESDILVTRIVALHSADVQLVSADDIIDRVADDDLRIVADDLKLVAANRSQGPGQVVAIDVSTEVNDLDAMTVATADNLRGDLIVREFDSIRLASSDAASDLEVVKTVNGQIIVTAANEIRVIDSLTFNEGPDLEADIEIEAQGVEGRIDFEAGDRIRLDDAVQLRAEKLTTRSLVPFLTEIQRDGQTELVTEIRNVVLRGDAAAYLKAGTSPSTGEVSFGDNIEINTGAEQGIARVFGPRPLSASEYALLSEDERFDTAFFDVGSVTTNVLEQADVNNATGILTLDIGVAGERGLTVNIDWGASTLRFEQIDGLSADASYFIPLLEQDPSDGGTADDGKTRLVDTPDAIPATDGLLKVEHKYTEEDILFSRLNGRESETKPIDVKFSVRHHESIVVLGSSVVQGEPEGAAVPELPEEIADQTGEPSDLPLTRGVELSRVVSATDNDDPTVQDENRNLTHNSGTTSFFIPSLSIPVAFFPVRDVIPEFEISDVVIRVDTVNVVPAVTFEQVASGVSGSVTRREYLQIVVIPPDPDAPVDEVVRAELPADVLSGDNLQRLLKGSSEEGIAPLPDGQYEIQYVLGDGNERTIFRFDLRDGVPTSLGDGLKEGVLKLKEISEEGRGKELPEQKEEPEPAPKPVAAASPAHSMQDQVDALATEPNVDGDPVTSTAAAAMTMPLLRRRKAKNSDQPAGRLSRSRRFVSRRTASES